MDLEGSLISKPPQAGSRIFKPDPVRGTLEISTEPPSHRGGLIYIPSTYDSTHPTPLLIIFHGAGGISKNILPLVQSFADEFNFIVFAPDSRDATWDIIIDDYGPDVLFTNKALEYIFNTYNINQKKVAMAGFSDGASYALSLGLTNGSIVTHILAFSPGFVAPSIQQGHPRIYVCHGKTDSILPIDRCSRQLVPALRQTGYNVDYIEFEEGHIIPPARVREAIEMFVR